MVNSHSPAGASAPALSVENIHKHFGGVQALRGVNLIAKGGEVLGLVGHNGAGKSTLIRIISGDLSADTGQIIMDGVPITLHSVRDATQKGIGVVRQELDLIPDLTVSENIFLGHEAQFMQAGFLNRNRMATAAEALIKQVGLEISPFQRLGTLSIGDQQLIAAARALRYAGKVLLLDEPTSSLSPWEAERLFEQVRMLASSGVAIIYISHRVDEVTNLCQRVVVLRDGLVVGEFPDPKNQQKAIIDTMAPGGISSTGEGKRTIGKVILEARNMRVGKHGPANFKLHAGEVVGIFGLIGAGRTTVARALVGDIRPDGGEILLHGEPIRVRSPYQGYKSGIAYLSESRKTESIFAGMNIRANMGLRAPQDTAQYGWIRLSQLRQLVDGLIQKLAIIPQNQNTPIEALSGGNQQKTVLGRLLADDLDVLVLDEPTHGIDVAAKADLLRLLNELASQGKAIAFISSELPELIHVSDRILVMRGGTVVKEFDPANVRERDIIGSAAGEKL